MWSNAIERRLNKLGWFVPGAILILLQLGLLSISTRFQYGQALVDRPVGLMVGLMTASGLVYLTALRQLKRPFFDGPRWWAWMLAVDLLMRLAMLISTPMMDDDYYRYLWDGAQVAHGHSPYAYAPQEIVAGSAPKKIGAKAAEGKEFPVDPALLLQDPNVCRGLKSCKGKGKGDHSCAGQGACATVKAHACNGMNDCKGQGGCGGYPGQNSCKEQGHCAVPLSKNSWALARKQFEHLMKDMDKKFGAAPTA